MQKICILQAACEDTPGPKQHFHNVKSLECELSYPGCANAGSNRIASYRPEANPLRPAGNAAPMLVTFTIKKDQLHSINKHGVLYAVALIAMTASAEISINLAITTNRQPASSMCTHPAGGLLKSTQLRACYTDLKQTEHAHSRCNMTMRCRQSSIAIDNLCTTPLHNTPMCRHRYQWMLHKELLHQAL